MKEGVNVKDVTLKVNGEQEKFTENFGICNYKCFLQRYRLDNNVILVIFARYPNENYYCSEKYYAIADENAKHIKLISKYGDSMPKDICKVLNKRFCESWKVKFV